MVLPLKDKWIVITRPKHQAASLRLTLEAAGANIILFPLLEIITSDNIVLAQKQLTRINEHDLVIFTSANAVDYALKWLDKSRLKTLKVAAIGKRTAKLLEEQGITVDYFPHQGFNSEAFLAMPEIQSYGANKKVAIIRGQNGRDYLKSGLEKQGAEVTYIDVYQRISPQSDLEQLSQQFDKNQLDIILITSGTSLINLFKYYPNNKWLGRVSFLLGSERIKKQLLKRYNYRGSLLVASDPSDETLYQQLLKWGNGGK